MLDDGYMWMRRYRTMWRIGDILKHLLRKAQTLKIPTRMDMEDTYTAVWYCGMVGWYSTLLFPIPLH